MDYSHQDIVPKRQPAHLQQQVRTQSCAWTATSAQQNAVVNTCHHAVSQVSQILPQQNENVIVKGLKANSSLAQPSINYAQAAQNGAKSFSVLDETKKAISMQKSNDIISQNNRREYNHISNHNHPDSQQQHKSSLSRKGEYYSSYNVHTSVSSSSISQTRAISPSSKAFHSEEKVLLSMQKKHHIAEKTVNGDKKEAKNIMKDEKVKNLKENRNQDSFQNAKVEKDGVDSDDANKTRGRGRRHRNRSKKRRSSSNKSDHEVENGDGCKESANVSEMTLHFEDVEEFPDLITSSRGFSQEPYSSLLGERSSLSGTSVSYSDAIKSVSKPP